MSHDQDPVFRKIIVPWYDSDILCVCWTLVMGFVLLFALGGLNIALQIRNDPSYTWIPLTLAGGSLFVIVSLLFRLFRRRFMK